MQLFELENNQAIRGKRERDWGLAGQALLDFTHLGIEKSARLYMKTEENQNGEPKFSLGLGSQN